MHNLQKEPENKPAAASVLGCIVCRKALDSVHQEAENHPDGAVVCTTRGNYGSTVFDPMVRPHRLEFNVCDDCLSAAAARGLVGLRYPGQSLVLWHPGLEDSHP